MKRVFLSFVFFMAFLGLFRPSYATNGMNLISLGPLGQGMGGADVAMPGACGPIATNPANLLKVCDRSYAIGSSFLAPRIHLKTRGLGIAPNNSIEAKRNVFPSPFVSAAFHLGDRWGIGLGIFARGGMGVDFKGVKTSFGTTDELRSRIRFARLTPGVVYSLTENMSLGLGMHLGYADVLYKFFPNTSFSRGDTGFFGQELKDARSEGYAFTAGWLWSVNERLNLGMDFTSRTAIDFRDGNLFIDMSSMGMGKVRYDGSIEDFTWPAQVRFGLSYQVNPRIKVAAEVRYIWWADALGTIKVKGKDPDLAGAPQRFQVAFPFQWHNQWVFSLGTELMLRRGISLRLGYNHGDNPVPDKNLTPLFPAIVEDHITVGMRFNCPCTKGFALDIAYVHAFEKTVSVNDPGNLFGPGLEVSHYQDSFAFFVSRHF